MNKNLFKTNRASRIPPAEAKNNEGGKAYNMTVQHELAQLALTGCFNSTYYVDAKDQVTRVMGLSHAVSPEFLAKLAVYAREKGYMKDMPAALLGALYARKENDLFKKVFPRVVDNGKMAKNFAQVVRSGAAGRKSFASIAKRSYQDWFKQRPADRLFEDSIGGDVRMADLIRLVHPCPESPTKKALYGYLLGKEHNAEDLPDKVRRFEAFKSGLSKEAPNVNFQFLTGMTLSDEAWKDIAKYATWDVTRRNLNTFARHNVFNKSNGYVDHEMVDHIAKRLRDPALVAKSRVFPYQMYTTCRSITGDVPQKVQLAMQEALDMSALNIPRFENRIYVCPDVSGSMTAPVTGHRKGATTSASCYEVSGLIAACFLKTHEANCKILPFSEGVYVRNFNPRDSIATITREIVSLGGGGTAVSAPIEYINLRERNGTPIDLVVIVSDNESWVDADNSYRCTALMNRWDALRKVHKNAKLVCIDLTPNRTQQSVDRPDILNVAGFSDAVFEMIRGFVAGETSGDHLSQLVMGVEL